MALALLRFVGIHVAVVRCCLTTSALWTAGQTSRLIGSVGRPLDFLGARGERAELMSSPCVGQRGLALFPGCFRGVGIGKMECFSSIGGELSVDRCKRLLTLREVDHREMMDV